jgi:TIR domain-containing protein
MKPQVFISYSHEDVGIVTEIERALQDIYVVPFKDDRSIVWGRNITESVQSALEECYAVIIVLSEASLKSQWVLYECGYAKGRGKLILPYITAPCLTIPMYLQATLAISSISELKRFFSSNDWFQFGKKSQTLHASNRELTHANSFNTVFRLPRVLPDEIPKESWDEVSTRWDAFNVWVVTHSPESDNLIAPLWRPDPDNEGIVRLFFAGSATISRVFIAEIDSYAWNAAANSICDGHHGVGTFDVSPSPVVDGDLRILELTQFVGDNDSTNS